VSRTIRFIGYVSVPDHMYNASDRTPDDWAESALYYGDKHQEYSTWLGSVDSVEQEEDE
jgi:hypothetical protein